MGALDGWIWDAARRAREKAPRAVALAREALRRAYLARVEAGGYAPDLIWVLGHVRSGSTLLAHVLASHRDVIGAGERSEVYASARDLDRAVADVHAWGLRLRFSARWVVDQINHDHLLEDERLLLHPRVRPILLVRAPEGAIPSMLALYPRWDATRALAAYLARLETLGRYAEEAGRRALFLTYEELTEQSARTLLALSRRLGLDPPLSARYRLHNFSARRGDRSARIRAGVVLPPRPPAPLPDDVARVAREAHARCLERLGAYARAVR